MEYSFASGANAKERLGNMIQRIMTCGYRVSAVGNWNGNKLAMETEKAQQAEKKGGDELAKILYDMVEAKTISKQYNLEWVKR